MAAEASGDWGVKGHLWEVCKARKGSLYLGALFSVFVQLAVFLPNLVSQKRAGLHINVHSGLICVSPNLE